MSKKMILLLFLIITFHKTVAAENRLELITYGPLKKVNWKHPGTVIYSLLFSLGKDLYYKEGANAGHFDIHVKCDDSNVEFWTGFTATDANQAIDEFFKKGDGLGIMVNSRKGALINEKEIKELLKKNPARIRTLSFNIDQAVCDDLYSFYQKYKDLNSLDVLQYSFLLNPSEFLGGTCESYAFSFLKIAGIYDNLFKNFKREVHISKRNIGHQYGNGSISAYKILNLISPMPWTYEGETEKDMIMFNFFDPEKVVSFFDEAYTCHQNVSLCPYEIYDFLRSSNGKFLSKKYLEIKK